MTHMPVSLWRETVSEPNPLDKLKLPANQPGDSADLAIIGGGFTGLSTALFAAKRGIDVQVFEAHDLGHGGSGRNVGLVNAGIWLSPSQTIAAVGPTYGPRFMDKFAAGPETVFDLIETHQIKCDATRTGTIHAAHSPAGYADLERRWFDWHRTGAPVDVLDRDEVTAKTGSNRFYGGLLDHRAGTINPMSYCHGLARVALAAGARIARYCPVIRLEKQAGGWLVHSADHVMTAKKVVLATNAYTDSLWPGLANSYMPIPYFQLATTPLGPRAGGILPGGQGLWDTGRIMISLRRDRDGRLIIGSMGPLIGTCHRGVSARWAHKTLTRLFPQLGPVDFASAWEGQIAMTADHLPKIYQLDDGLFTPIGYNGRGITTGTLFGHSIAGLLAGDDPTHLPLPLTTMSREAGRRLGAILLRSIFAANQLVKSW